MKNWYYVSCEKHLNSVTNFIGGLETALILCFQKVPYNSFVSRLNIFSLYIK